MKVSSGTSGTAELLTVLQTLDARLTRLETTSISAIDALGSKLEAIEQKLTALSVAAARASQKNVDLHASTAVRLDALESAHQKTARRQQLLLATLSSADAEVAPPKQSVVLHSVVPSLSDKAPDVAVSGAGNTTAARGGIRRNNKV